LEGGWDGDTSVFFNNADGSQVTDQARGSPR
jgi:hypothetical protein